MFRVRFERLENIVGYGTTSVVGFADETALNVQVLAVGTTDAGVEAVRIAFFAF